MTDCLIVGAGVVGLSLAYELAHQGARVRVIDAGPPGAEASWAGAGILPPVGPLATGAAERLAAISNRLHAQWHERLREETGIDNGYRRSGGIYLARFGRCRGPAARNRPLATPGRERGRIGWRRGLARVEPAAGPSWAAHACCFLNEECQVRNPRHLRAIIASLAKNGVEISAGLPADDFVTDGRRITAVRTPGGLIEADSVCIAGGAWSSALVARLTEAPAIVPVRGQIVLLAQQKPSITRVVNERLRISFREMTATCSSAQRKKTSVSTAGPPPTPSRICSISRFLSSPRWPTPASNAVGPACALFRPTASPI